MEILRFLGFPNLKNNNPQTERNGDFLSVEHRADPGQQPCGGDSAILNQRNEPTDFKKASVQFFALGIEMPLVNSILLQEPGNALYAAGLARSVKGFIKPQHNSVCRWAIYSRPTHGRLWL